MFSSAIFPFCRYEYEASALRNRGRDARKPTCRHLVRKFDFPISGPFALRRLTLNISFAQNSQDCIGIDAPLLHLLFDMVCPHNPGSTCGLVGQFAHALERGFSAELEAASLTSAASPRTLHQLS